jgi:hypothetical protein
MCRPSPLRLLGALALVGLMMLGTVDAANASLRSLWRYAVLSYDNPATQHADELACESSPTSEAGADARQFTRLACRPSGRLVPTAVERYDAAPDPGAGITRAPPSV